MNLAKLLGPDCTVCAVPGSSKKNVLEQISKIASKRVSSLTEKDLLGSLISREKLSSTGIGNGIAIPHGRIANTERVIAVLLTTEHPIEFDAIDNKPVDIFFSLFVPEDHCQEHLQTLSSIAQFFSDKDTCKKVRRCQTSDQLYQLISAQ